MKRHAYSLLRTFFIVLLIVQVTVACASRHTTHAKNGINEANPVAGKPESCQSNKLIRSQKLINYIFDDMNKTYPHTGGGGITSIKETETNTFEVSIAQEERMDLLIYRLGIDGDCQVTLKSKEESTINFGR